VPTIGHSLEELRLRETGVEVSAVPSAYPCRRPHPETRIELDDVLVLLGTPPNWLPPKVAFQGPLECVGDRACSRDRSCPEPVPGLGLQNAAHTV
jgi:hypothetical protein